MRKRKQKRRGLSGPVEHHARMASIWIRRGTTLIGEAFEATERGRCEDAILDLTNAAAAYGRAVEHAHEGKLGQSVDRGGGLADRITDVRPKIARCFRDRGGR